VGVDSDFFAMRGNGSVLNRAGPCRGRTAGQPRWRAFFNVGALPGRDCRCQPGTAGHEHLDTWFREQEVREAHIFGLRLGDGQYHLGAAVNYVPVLRMLMNFFRLGTALCILPARARLGRVVGGGRAGLCNPVSPARHG
jgi:hypothetical protein